MLVASRGLVGAFALLSCIGLACAPVTRTYDNLGGASGQGAGGDPGVGGAPSSSPTSTSASGSNSSGMCAAVEDCFNGVDDDCNGATDCEDPACGVVAVCEPQADTAQNGVVVGGGEACPAGYTAGEQIINRNLVDGGCTGCACMLKGATCTGNVWYYPSAAACTGDALNTGGMPAGNFGFACDSTPISSGQTYGARTSTWKAQNLCTGRGAATAAPVTWGETMKFCAASKVGKGCSAGNVCVPNIKAAPHCALASGSATCGAFKSAQSDWYTGFTDGRTCGACGCIASGVDCTGVTLEVGSDYSCINAAVVPEKTKKCFSGSGIYAPPVHLVGAPNQGTCEGVAPVTGSLDPTGQATLCCQM